MLLSLISLIVIDEGPYKTAYHAESDKNNIGQMENTDFTSEININYNESETNIVHQGLDMEGHFIGLRTTLSPKTASELKNCDSFSGTTHKGNLNVSNHRDQCNKTLSSNACPTENLTDDREENFINEQAKKMEVKNSFCAQIKELVIQSPIVQMFTLIQWSLMKQPYYVITMIGSSYSFTALLNYFLLLPLLSGCFDLSPCDYANPTANILRFHG